MPLDAGKLDASHRDRETIQRLSVLSTRIGPVGKEIQGKLGDFEVWEDPDSVLQTFVCDACVNISPGKSDPADDLRPGLCFASGVA